MKEVLLCLYSFTQEFFFKLVKYVLWGFIFCQFAAASCLGQDSMPSEEEMRRVEEERIQVLNNIEELEQKIKELENQMEESAREVPDLSWQIEFL